MIKLRIFLFISFSLLLTGCASIGIDGVKNIDNLNDGEKILVISSIGNSYNAIHVGALVFSNESKKIDVSSWHIDDYMEHKISVLINNTRFKSVRSYNKESLPMLTDNSWTGGVDFHGAKNKIKNIAESAGADLVLVVHQINRGDPFFQTNQIIKGYGYYSREGMDSILYTYIGVNIFDAKTMKEIASSVKWTKALAHEPIYSSDLSGITRDTISRDQSLIKGLLLRNVTGILKDLHII